MFVKAENWTKRRRWIFLNIFYIFHCYLYASFKFIYIYKYFIVYAEVCIVSNSWMSSILLFLLRDRQWRDSAYFFFENAWNICTYTYIECIVSLSWYLTFSFRARKCTTIQLTVQPQPRKKRKKRERYWT